MKKIATSTMILCMLTGSIAHAAEKKQTNVVLIMVDDMGYECINAYGGTSYQTPHIDQLARDGILFQNAHSQPICTPSRVQIMTGKYNVRNYTGFAKLDEKETTFGHLFQAAGYKTCILGKWQLGGDLNRPFQMGFDEYCLWKIGGINASRYLNPGLGVNAKETLLKGEYGPDIMLDYAKDFISNNKSEPFFLYWPMILVHYPHEPTPDSRDWDPDREDSEVPEDTVYFSDMMRYMDKNLGKIVAFIDSMGLAENTLIIFTADNGSDMKIYSRFMGQLIQGGKGLPTDAGTRVALIASWKGTIKPGRVSADLIDFSDILPTICDAANVPIPEKLAPEIDGISFLPQLKGKTGNPREYSYCWYEHRVKKDWIRQFVHDTTYKLYITGEFYNVKDDVLEKHPIADSDLTTKELAIKEKFQEVLDKYDKLRQ